MLKVTGLFDSAQAALLAGERVREVAGPRASVRVLVPGSAGSVLEVSVLGDESALAQVALLGVGIGIVGMLALLLAGMGWAASLLWLAVGALGGTLLGIWLTGELDPARTVAGPEARRCHDALVLGGHGLLAATVRDERHAAMVRRVIVSAGGQVRDGVLRQLCDLPTPPLPQAT